MEINLLDTMWIICWMKSKSTHWRSKLLYKTSPFHTKFQGWTLALLSYIEGFSIIHWTINVHGVVHCKWRKYNIIIKHSGIEVLLQRFNLGVASTVWTVSWALNAHVVWARWDVRSWAKWWYHRVTYIEHGLDCGAWSISTLSLERGPAWCMESPGKL